MYKQLPPFEDLADLFEYNVLTGRLHYRKRPHPNGRQIGAIAGGIDRKGYHRVRIKGQDYKASRVIYKLMTGVDPDQLSIDHIDINSLNDCIWNLRLATQTEQIHNRSLRCTGVRPMNGKYQMRIQRHGKRICKTFSTHAEAISAYNHIAYGL